MAVDSKSSAGFTLIETLIVMGLMAVMMGLVIINLGKPQSEAGVAAAVAALKADMREQQTRAMAGESGDGVGANAWGVHFESNRYVLFHGASYSANDSGNFEVDLGPGVAASTSLPSGTLVYEPRSGEISGWTDGQNTVTLTHPAGDTETLVFNRYGIGVAP